MSTSSQNLGRDIPWRGAALTMLYMRTRAGMRLFIRTFEGLLPQTGLLPTA